MRILIFLLLLGCVEEDPTIVYTISKGEHYSNPRTVLQVDRNPFVFYAKFDYSAMVESEDINKLYGFTEGQVHENSARFGWRYHSGNIEIFAYCYCNSVRSFEYLGNAVVGKWQRYEINVGKDYVFLFQTKKSMKRCANSKTLFTLQPYYGGNEVAPHDIKIAIR